jgi:transposase
MVRRRIIELYEQQMTTKQIADLFGVARSGVRRVKQRLRERGTLEPLRGRVGRKPLLTDEVSRQIRQHIATYPDATREELKSALGLTVSVQSISKWLKRLGLVLKKSRSTRPSRIVPMSPRVGRAGTTS